MAINTKNVLVGVAQLYFAPYGTEEAPTTPAPVPTSTSTTWGDTYTAIGATQEGVKITVNRKTTDIMVEEQPTPADVTTDTMTVEIAVTLAEDTITNMKLAYGGGTIAVVAATATEPGTSTLSLALGLEKLTIGFQGVNKYGKWRRVYVPLVLSTASVDTSYRRAAAARLYPATFRAICTPSDIKVIEKTATKTGA